MSSAMDDVHVLLVDNYDSFTFNLEQLVGAMGAKVSVRRNDAFAAADLPSFGATHIIVSPGPGNPANASDFGVCADLIACATLPLLGVCLGHQGIAYHLGGRVVEAPAIVHGKISRIAHDGTSVFAGLPPTIDVMRYHSLTVEPRSLPSDLRITAQTADGVIMGLAHRRRSLHGIQFHPESFATPDGAQMLRTFLEMT
jgi:anthranilate synthase component 2